MSKIANFKTLAYIRQVKVKRAGVSAVIFSSQKNKKLVTLHKSVTVKKKVS